MTITRRHFVATAAGAAVALPVLASAQRVPQLLPMPPQPLDLSDYMVGPMPFLPSVSTLPNPPGFLLFANGGIRRVSGFCGAVQLYSLAGLGFARRIPYGIDVTTDAQKLWFLGRTSFGRPLTNEVIELQRAWNRQVFMREHSELKGIRA